MVRLGLVVSLSYRRLPAASVLYGCGYCGIIHVRHLVNQKSNYPSSVAPRFSSVCPSSKTQLPSSAVQLRSVGPSSNTPTTSALTHSLPEITRGGTPRLSPDDRRAVHSSVGPSSNISTISALTHSLPEVSLGGTHSLLESLPETPTHSRSHSRRHPLTRGVTSGGTSQFIPESLARGSARTVPPSSNTQSPIISGSTQLRPSVKQHTNNQCTHLLTREVTPGITPRFIPELLACGSAQLSLVGPSSNIPTINALTPGGTLPFIPGSIASFSQLLRYSDTRPPKARFAGTRFSSAESVRQATPQ